MTRTFRIPDANQPAEESALFAVYQIVLAAQRAAVAAIRPGVRCNEVDAAARRVITLAGYGDGFGHNTGHAIGIEVHENPRFSPLTQHLWSLACCSPLSRVFICRGRGCAY